ncbi:BBE domain-containing protein [Ectobacillus sp. JY-23]|nr:BBE domain-containing protein [Ectobacillus sp. JY-23]UOY93073.1 BBE domain-containing protein [Ectobacillus sp. JY-23]
MQNYEKSYFGGNVKMLRKVNEKYDPLQVFRFPQSIQRR